jgi:hypothetical protein
LRQALPPLHWEASWQLVRQVPSAQVDGAQEIGAPATQVPSPSQLLGGIRLAGPAQLGCAHTVPAAYLVQAPWPLQKPLWPQVSMGSTRQSSCRSLAPAGTAEHSPALSGRLQATQAPVQATLQHTPSAQNPDSHCSASVQATPGARFAQAPAEQQIPCSHSPVLHSLSQVQICPGSRRNSGAGPQLGDPGSGASMAVPASPGSREPASRPDVPGSRPGSIRLFTGRVEQETPAQSASNNRTPPRRRADTAQNIQPPGATYLGPRPGDVH